MSSQTGPYSLKRFAILLASAIGRLPGNEHILRGLAALPVSCKSAALERIAAAIVRHGDMRQEFIETNAGIADRLRLLVPLRKTGLAFGTPANDIQERATLALARVLSGHCEHFLDIGANEGIFAFQTASQWNSDRHDGIHVFEPDPVLFARLKRNFDRNAIRARLQRVAASDRNGETIFYRNQSDDCSGSLEADFAEHHERMRIRVNAMRMDDYLLERDIRNALVKMDVEGAGARVWEGMRSAQDRIGVLICELLLPEVKEKLARRIIAETGMYAYYIRDFDLIFSPEGEFDYQPPFWNWLFCHYSPMRLSGIVGERGFNVITQDSAQALRNFAAGQNKSERFFFNGGATRNEGARSH